MSSITTRPATDDDVADLAPRLRQPDLDALTAAFPTLPAADALKLAKDRGECHVACLDGRPVGLFGITTSPLRPARGFPWFTLAAEPLLSEAAIADLVRLSARLVDRWQGRFPELVAMNDPRNAIYADWLKFLGFVEMDTVPTASGLPFTTYLLEAPRTPSSSSLHSENTQ